MKKRISKAFGKKIYLIGRDQEDKLIWLEEPSWDCGWYWGFGYLETYTNSDPKRARDILSHRHVDGFISKEIDGEYIHHFNESPKLKDTVLTDSESWQLADLFNSFYTLKDTAELFYQGNSHLTSTRISLKNKELYKLINEKIMPEIFKEIKSILTPESKKT